MKACFVLGTVSRNALELGDCISQADIDALEHVAEKCGLEADIVLACQDRSTWGLGSKVTLKAIRAERSRVLEEIRASEPELIVAMGPAAARCLWNRGVKVSDLFHQLHELEDMPCPVWASYSLEEIAMKPGLVKFVGIDLLHAVHGETDVRWRDHVVQWEQHPRLDFSGGVCSADTETFPSLDPWHKDARIRMVQIATDPDFAQVVQLPPDSSLPQWLADVLADPDILKVGGNFAYDAKWFTRFGYTVRNFSCTSHRQHLIDENSALKDLKTLTLIHTDIGDYSRDHRNLVTERGGWEFVRDDEQYHYAAADAYAGMAIYQAQQRLVEEQGLEQPIAVQQYTYPALTALQNAGACISMTENERLQDAYTEVISRLTGEIRAVLGEAINPASPVQLARALQKYVPDINLTEYFKRSWDLDEEEKYTTKAAILRREEHKHPIVAKVLEFRRRTALRNFVKGIPKHVVERGGQTFVHTSLRGDVAATKRKTSSKPNMQNLPRDTATEIDEALNPKRQYISRFAGGHILEADHSQLELRVAGVSADDRAFREAFMSGQDVHTRLAAQMRGLREDQVTPAIRTAGKTTTFHTLYGGGAWGLAYRLNIGKPEADELIADFYSTFKDFRDWQRQKEAEVKENLEVRSLFGLVRHFVRPPTWKSPAGRRILRQAVNAPIQGDASYITDIGITQVVDNMEGMRSVPFLTVHDSLIVDVAPGEDMQVLAHVLAQMEGTDTERWGVKFDLPLVVDVKMGETWGCMKEVVRV